MALVDLQQLAARLRQWEARRSLLPLPCAGARSSGSGGGEGTAAAARDLKGLGARLRRDVFLGLL